MKATKLTAWGNLTNISGLQGWTGCNTETAANPVSSNNQVTGFCYDGAGNLLDMGACAQAPHNFVYDAEDQLQSPPATNNGVGSQYVYFYDGDGTRVQKCNANPCTSTSTGTLYWLGLGGEVLDESDRNGHMQEEYLYFNGERIARRDVVSGAVHYYFSDHLGSASVITDSSGNIQQQIDYYPYGGIAYTSGADNNHYKFTGKERDFESNLDNFGARYYASSAGRFMTPDWAARPTAVPYANFGDPQTLNLYTYVENAPVNHADADGHSKGYEYPTCGCGGWDLSSMSGSVDASDDNSLGPEITNMQVMAQLRQNDQMAHNTESASGSGGTTTIHRADGSTETRTGTIAFRDYNPGDERSGHGAIGIDHTKTNGDFAIYSSDKAGFSALDANLHSKYWDKSIAATMKAFAPKSDHNNPKKYAADLAREVGVRGSTKLSALSATQLQKFEHQIAVHEGFYVPGKVTIIPPTH